jgi:3-deoxy-manno-octulosonate cytidylyltransferase (CMP-KDO synthetase)
MTKAIGIIPARWGSTRFPGKPLHLIAGKPLLRRVWERCRRARSLDRVIIATDDQRIAQAARAWGAEAAMTSKRHATGTDRIAEVARKITDARYIINIQGDEPLIDPGLINRLVATLRSKPSVEMITAGHPFPTPADMLSRNQVKVAASANGRVVDFSRQRIAVKDSSTKLLRHQGIYGFKRAALLRFVRWAQSPRERLESLEQLRALENGVTVHVLVTRHGSPGVDTPQDARRIAASLKSNTRSRVARPASRQRARRR